ncbi:MAG: class I SAM-dependent DNA methyltransferase, partial [Planctomycetia bacterium]|nr:class I SAM-dependent DNA methyltransferase [Planctomycetia bacterium]
GLSRNLGGQFPVVGPGQLYGIEVSEYAHDLAQMTVWIGYLQWMHDHAYSLRNEPILGPAGNIRCMDAIIDLSDPANPKDPEWPEVDFIVGNPPFLGDKLMRQHMGDDYVDALRKVYEGRVPGGADLCAYWFERASEHIVAKSCKRAGLLATQNIRGGASRKVIDRLVKTGKIFMAWSDRDWVLDGANVHISMIGFDDGTETSRTLDGQTVREIHSNLSATSDSAHAKPLPENMSVGFVGSCKGGPFDITLAEAQALLEDRGNPNGRPNSDVLRPVVNSSDLLGRNEPRWIIDNADRELADACLYTKPQAIVEEKVKPLRDKNRNKWLRENWWRPQRMRAEMRAAIAPLPRFIVTPTTSKHRIFAWMVHPTLPDHQLIVFARSDDYFFGVLHSSIHELWARRMGTQLRESESGFRYTPTTCFETFPLPWPPGKEPADDPLCRRIAAAAKELDAMRERWLNPPEWIEPIAAAVDAADSFADIPAEARGLIRQSAIMAAAAKDPNLKKRTLTYLYNQRPTWLKLAHAELDRSVLAAYAAIDPDGGWSPGWAEMWADTGAGQALPNGHPLTARRTEIDQKVLANPLRLNQGRSRA